LTPERKGFTIGGVNLERGAGSVMFCFCFERSEDSHSVFTLSLMRVWQQGEQKLKRLYIGNLPYRATEADLTAWFQQQAVTTGTVNVMRDRFSNESRGFGFAEVEDADLERAVEACSGKQFMGRALVINEARPMEKGGAHRRTRTSSGAEHD
jgi:RNA recognition motif. (a.k.a. RRM, RBD, or RNP domain)